MAGYIGNQFKISGRYKVDEFTSVGGTTYTLSSAPGDKNNIQVSAGGLVQYPSAYSVSGTTLTLSGVPATQKIVVRHMGDTIPFPNLDADVVTGAKIADNAVDSEHYTDGSIDNIHTNFQPGTTFKGDGSSARGKIVLNCEMNTHGVSIQSPAHSAAASYTLTLPPNDGAANEALTTDGSGVLSWAAAGGGAWNFISTAGNGAAFTGQSGVTIGGIDTTYAIYAVVCAGMINTSDGNSIGLQLGDSSGIDTGGSDYSFHSARPEAGGSGYAGSNSTGATYIEVMGGTGNAAGEGATCVTYIVPHASIRPMVYGTGCWLGTSTTQVTGNHGGSRNASIVVTQFRIAPTAGTISGRISLFGISHS